MLKDEVFVEESPAISTDYETERNKPMPNRIHGTIQTEISFLLKSKYGEKYDFPSEVTLATTPASTPDICIFTKRELDWTTIEAKEQEAPITTIEIISPSQSLTEMAQKIYQTYFPIGVKSAWIVMPPPFKAIYILNPDGSNHFFDHGTLTDEVTGVQLEIEKVFEGMK